MLTSWLPCRSRGHRGRHGGHDPLRKRPDPAQVSGGGGDGWVLIGRSSPWAGRIPSWRPSLSPHCYHCRMSRVMVLRLCGPATTALPPFIDMPEDIRAAVDGGCRLLSGARGLRDAYYGGCIIAFFVAMSGGVPLLLSPAGALVRSLFHHLPHLLLPPRTCSLCYRRLRVRRCT